MKVYVGVDCCKLAEETQLQVMERAPPLGESGQNR